MSSWTVSESMDYHPVFVGIVEQRIKSSTNNTRIERLWVEVGSQFARRWRAFFYRLEALHGLDRTNPHHLCLLHFLFLDLINEDCTNFRAEWNCHPISVREGVYLDDCAGVHPDIIQQYYGTRGPQRRQMSGQTGAGQLDDEDISLPSSNLATESSSEVDLEELVEEAHAGNFHDAVGVPKHANPFSDDGTMQLFYDSLEATIRTDIVPPGYGLLPEEWEGGEYPTFEILKSGRRGGRELRVALPDAIWRPRAVMWGRALAVLEQIGYVNETLG
ncbi:hypothetical protein C8R45DRAFT_1138343 [Mycena sanguinolenta]|nr:hypothetical protein C8R45DRAFT_1138343 [Mycena sanguinolenta]